MTRRRLVAWLPADKYRELVALADQEDRGVEQQASHLLRNALDERQRQQNAPRAADALPVKCVTA
jgi:hypothetical protein